MCENSPAPASNSHFDEAAPLRSAGMVSVLQGAGGIFTVPTNGWGTIDQCLPEVLSHEDVSALAVRACVTNKQRYLGFDDAVTMQWLVGALRALPAGYRITLKELKETKSVYLPTFPLYTMKKLMRKIWSRFGAALVREGA